MSSAAQRLAPTPAWFGHVELVLERAAGEVRILSALTPCDARGERSRLTGELRSGRPAVPRWTYARRPHDELRRALDWAQEMLERSDLTALEALYLERARELSLEAAMCAAAGARELAELARARFEPREPTVVRAAAALCKEWLAEPSPAPAGPMLASDDPDPASLLQRMRAAVGRLRLPFGVVTSPWLAPLAATGERVILVATGRLVPDEDAARTVLHEIEGHARPRARSAHATSAHFPHRNGARASTTRRAEPSCSRSAPASSAPAVESSSPPGTGRSKRCSAVRRSPTSRTPSSRRTASTRRRPIIVAERAFRGGDGTRPGLGRERVYLESLVRVRRHLTAHPDDDEVLASGQVAVDAAALLRPFAAPS